MGKNAKMANYILHSVFSQLTYTKQKYRQKILLVFVVHVYVVCCIYLRIKYCLIKPKKYRFSSTNFERVTLKKNYRSSRENFSYRIVYVSLLVDTRQSYIEKGFK